MILFNSHTILDLEFYPQCTDEETEAQKGCMICPKARYKIVNLASHPGLNSPHP